MRANPWSGLLAAAPAAVTLALGVCAARAQTDEIQVYDARIAEPGTINLTLHDNYTPDGLKTPAFPGGIVPNHSLNGVPEFALGVTPWFEAGLYLPLYTATADRVELDGFKVRALFVEPDAGSRRFFYGVNFEFSVNARHWDVDRYTSEIRPILGWRAGRFDVIVNPILDNSWKGLSRLDFAPEYRVDYNLSKVWAIGVEEYDDYGPLRALYSGGQQVHQLFGVVDWSGRPLNVEFGAGVGLSRATDGLVVKLILSKDIANLHWRP